MRRFDGTVAVVTGASSGIGRRLAIDLATEGATVIGIARRAAALEETARVMRHTSPASEALPCDVSDVDGFIARLADIEERHGRIDVLVNDAGIEEPTAATSAEGAAGATLEAYRRIFATNFFGLVAATLAVLPGMLSRSSGIIVNVSSDAARAPQAGQGAYSASKAAVSAFSECVAHEVAPHGVHVHVLYPGWVPTAMGLRAAETPPRSVRRTEEQVSALTLARMGGSRLEINAAWPPRLVPIVRTVAPRLYQRAIRARAPG